MRLDIYLKTNGISQRDLAEKVKITATHMNLIANRRCTPSKKVAKVIEEMTNGEVTRMELLYPEEAM